ncbi:hypothetical protein [Roseivirga thermotolerans]|uniref:hypothetical protein n=1 Tax=Roseivirga thermotolerans TaxID=1758176 RepID=UPI00273F708E|nr:hypothetical protein [Roseivirga thermotolerans]
MTKNNDSFKEKVKQDYLNQLRADFNYSIEKFDSQALFISSGALGISLAFIKDLVPIGSAINIWMFLFSLWIFVFSILLGFLAHLYSSNSIAKRIQLVDQNKLDEIKENRLIPALNKFQIFIIFFGIFMLVLFVTTNIIQMSDKENKVSPQENNSSTKITIDSRATVEKLSMPVSPMPSSLKPSTGAPANSSGQSKPSNSGHSTSKGGKNG